MGATESKHLLLEWVSEKQPQRGKFCGGEYVRQDSHLLRSDGMRYKSKMSDFWLISLEFSPLYTIFNKIQASNIKSNFGNVIYEGQSTFLLIGLRYFHKLLSFEILG
jgi:hypothetical protein